MNFGHKCVIRCIHIMYVKNNSGNIEVWLDFDTCVNINFGMMKREARVSGFLKKNELILSS